MNPTASTEHPPFAALIGLDWADQKHDLCTLEDGALAPVASQLQQSPEAIDQWAIGLRQRFGGRPVAVCLEQSRGALIFALMKYDFLVLYPLAPARLAKYRAAMSCSGAKDDPTDAALLLDYLRHHRDHLVAWKPEDPLTREIALLAQSRRDAVQLRTQLSNRLKAALKAYFPQAIDWLGSVVHNPMACDFLLKWPSLDELQNAKPETIRKFYYAHNCRRGDLIQKRIDAIAQARPLTTDPAILNSSILLVQMLAHQLRPLTASIQAYDDKIKTLMDKHPDAAIFRALPGAGDALAPRLLAAFGSDRDRLQSAATLQTLSGIAPVTKRSGKQSSVHRRWACPNFLRQTFHEFANYSRMQSPWAAAYYQSLRSKGKGHHAALRALAFKWIRILFACWKNRTPYDEANYLQALTKRNSPLIDLMNKDRSTVGKNCSQPSPAHVENS